MTYPDPNNVRCYRHSLNLNQYEQDLFIAIANFKGGHPATIIRELAVAHAMDILSLPADPIVSGSIDQAVNPQR